VPKKVSHPVPKAAEMVGKALAILADAQSITSARGFVFRFRADQHRLSLKANRDSFLWREK